MPDSDIQPTPTEEPQTPTPAPELTPEIPQTKSVESIPAPIEPPPSSVEQLTPEPPPHPSEPPQSAQTPPPPTPTPQSTPSEPAQLSPSQIFPQKNLGGQDPRSLLQHAREKIQFRKKVKLEKIMALAAKKRSIANDDIEKLLRVSDATATRYLAELVRQGRLKQNGATKSIRFEPIL